MNYIYYMLSLFLSAPSFFHIFINPAFISLLLFDLYVLYISFAKKNISRKLLPMAVLFVLFFFYSLSISLYNGFENKSTAYVAFYLLYFVSILSLSNYSLTQEINYIKIKKITFYMMLFLVVFSFIEYYYILNKGGLITWMPRSEREDYASNSFSDLYRIRLFTAESSSAGFVVNVLYLAYFIVRDKVEKIFNSIFLIMAIILHVLTFSTTQFISFAVILLMQIAFDKRFHHLLWVMIVVVVSVMTLYHQEIYSIFEYIFLKTNSFLGGASYSSSGSERYELFLIGFNAFMDNPIIGGGYASFYKYIDTGLVSFYLQTLQQFGIFGFLIFLLFSIYPMCLVTDINMRLLLVLSQFTLIFSGGVWDSVFYLPYMFLGYKVYSNE